MGALADRGRIASIRQVAGAPRSTRARPRAWRAGTSHRPPPRRGPHLLHDREPGVERDRSIWAAAPGRAHPSLYGHPGSSPPRYCRVAAWSARPRRRERTGRRPSRRTPRRRPSRRPNPGHRTAERRGRSRAYQVSCSACSRSRCSARRGCRVRVSLGTPVARQSASNGRTRRVEVHVTGRIRVRASPPRQRAPERPTPAGASRWRHQRPDGRQDVSGHRPTRLACRAGCNAVSCPIATCNQGANPPCGCPPYDCAGWAECPSVRRSS